MRRDIRCLPPVLVRNETCPLLAGHQGHMGGVVRRTAHLGPITRPFHDQGNLHWILHYAGRLTGTCDL